MRRLSVLLACAAIFLSAFVVFTYLQRAREARRKAPPSIEKIPANVDARAKGWSWKKHEGNRLIVQGEARSFTEIHEPSTYQLTGLKLRLYGKNGDKFTYVQSENAEFDTNTGLMQSQGEATITMDVPADKNPDDPATVTKLVKIKANGAHYETKSGKVTTDQPAFFDFDQGQGKCVGAEYDPATRELHMKSQADLLWIGSGPVENAMHIEAGDLVYKEVEGKVYLSPWSRLTRGSMRIEAKNSVVTLVDGRIQLVESEMANGRDQEPARQIEYAANKMWAMFSDEGVINKISGDQQARLVSSDGSSRTTVTSNHIDLHFTPQMKQVKGIQQSESILTNALTTGNSVIESAPLPKPGVQLAETRILRGEVIEMAMKPGGQEIQTVRTQTPGQIEFKPNRPDQAHRVVDASRITVQYGASNSIEKFLATKVKTRTDKPAVMKKENTASSAKPLASPTPAFTWSDELSAAFTPGTSQLARLEQWGNFRYEEGDRKAKAERALIEQQINKITLTESATVSDETGITSASQIILDQQNGDFEALGNVTSVRQPDKKPESSSLLDQSQPMQAKADKMRTHDNNLNIFYDGHAVLWQGANRISAQQIEIDRDEGTLHAKGDVVSELVDKDTDDDQPASNGGDTAKLETVAEKKGQKENSSRKGSRPTAPVYTVITAPDLMYRDDTRVAHYTGGVKFTHLKMTVTSRELRAFLNDSSKDSSLDHAIADGDVVVVQVGQDRTRTGMSDHAEYYATENKVILNGGSPQLVDSNRGVTRGAQLTYYADDNRFFVEGASKKLVRTRMKKK